MTDTIVNIVGQDVCPGCQKSIHRPMKSVVPDHWSTDDERYCDELREYGISNIPKDSPEWAAFTAPDSDFSNVFSNGGLSNWAKNWNHDDLKIARYDMPIETCGSSNDLWPVKPSSICGLISYLVARGIYHRLETGVWDFKIGDLLLFINKEKHD